MIPLRTLSGCRAVLAVCFRAAGGHLGASSECGKPWRPAGRAAAAPGSRLGMGAVPATAGGQGSARTGSLVVVGRLGVPCAAPSRCVPGGTWRSDRRAVPAVQRWLRRRQRNGCADDSAKAAATRRAAWLGLQLGPAAPRTWFTGLLQQSNGLVLFGCPTFCFCRLRC